MDKMAGPNVSFIGRLVLLGSEVRMVLYIHTTRATTRALSKVGESAM